MDENTTPPAEETPAEETPAEETPAEETPAEETPASDNNLQKLLDDLKNDFAAKMAAQAAHYEKQIKERDQYIKKLLSPNAAPIGHNGGVAERLNAKRDFKKW